METNEQPVARLTFNAEAVRQCFESDRLHWLRVRIERGGVLLRPSVNRSRDDEMIPIVRGKRGITAEIDPTQFSRRLMNRLFKAGLTDDAPYFLLMPASGGWFDIEHVPEPRPPQRRALMTVSNFEAPPMRIDMAIWRRFRQQISAGAEVADDTWEQVRDMVLAAHETSERKRGRRSQDRVEAEKLLTAVRTSVSLLDEWQAHQPAFADSVNELLTTLGFVVSRDWRRENVRRDSDQDKPVERVHEMSHDRAPPESETVEVPEFITDEASEEALVDDEPEPAESLEPARVEE